jgi:uncharacterized protein
MQAPEFMGVIGNRNRRLSMGLFSVVFGGPLTKAVVKRDAAEVERLLKNGVDPNEAQLGVTALINACNMGSVEIVKMLLSKGADPDKKDWEGWRPLMAAASGASHADSRNKEPICLEIVQLLIAGGADVNARGKRGQTALKYAKSALHENVAELLIQHGAKG